MNNEMNSEKKLAYKVSGVTIIGNLLLCIFKFLCGIIGCSQAMVSDAIHSASDIFSTIIVIVGVKISHKESDDDHRYGHERYECLAAIILAVILGFTSLYIGYSGITTVISGDYEKIKAPTVLALIAAIISIIVKELMYHYTMHAAKKINSDSLKADAWHHRSDAISSIGSLIGIGGAMLGFLFMDALASIIICIVILKAAVDIIKDAMDKLVDKSCDRETIEQLIDIAKNTDGVIDIDDIKTRLFGNKIYVDIEICCDGDLSLREAHDIADLVHDRIENSNINIKHCMVHINPD
ncbi:MAG: cation diffusion facilitator family transporter [Ruminococcus sp.]